MRNSFIAVVVFITMFLMGCSTGYVKAEKEEHRVRTSSRLMTEMPIPPRSECMKREMASRGADPSRLTIGLTQMENSALAKEAGMTGQTPQPMFFYPVQDAVASLGFSVPIELKSVLGEPKPGNLILDAGLVAFSPLTKATTGREEIDLVVPQWAREKVVAKGSVTAVATLYAPLNGAYKVWQTSNSTAIFFQVKDSTRINLALKSGASGGTADESIEIVSVQEASSLVMREAAIKVLDKAFGTKCIN